MGCEQSDGHATMLETQTPSINSLETGTSVMWKMGAMFSSARSFNKPIGDWNVSSVRQMWSMFGGALSFNQPIGNWGFEQLKKTSGTLLHSTIRSKIGMFPPVKAWPTCSEELHLQPNEWNVSGRKLDRHVLEHPLALDRQQGPHPQIVLKQSKLALWLVRVVEDSQQDPIPLFQFPIIIIRKHSQNIGSSSKSNPWPGSFSRRLWHGEWNSC